MLATAGASKALRNPSNRHIRQWYLLADLYERAGDVPRARELFERVLRVDREAYDVRTAGRPRTGAQAPRPKPRPKASAEAQAAAERHAGQSRHAGRPRARRRSRSPRAVAAESHARHR